MGIGTDFDTGAELGEGWGGFVDVDGDVGMLEETEGAAEAGDAAAYDGDARAR